jgi:ABC-type amino acid transport substrate-binding protein
MLRSTYLHAHAPSHPSTCSRLALVAVAALACTLLTGPICAAAEAKPPSPSTQREQITISPEEAMKPWTGDLDGMIKRRFIRVLTVYSKSFYFVDKGVQRGAAYDFFRLVEADLNKKLAKDKAPNQKHLKVNVMFIPVARDELLPALVDGKGDIAASNLTITDERQKLVDFTLPMYDFVPSLRDGC